MNSSQTTIEKTLLSPRELKEGLGALLPFSKKSYPKQQGISTKELEDKILFDFDNGYLAFTDCIRLALYPSKQMVIDINSTPLRGQYIISVEAAQKLKNSLKKGDATTPVSIADNSIIFDTSKGPVSASIFDLTFPSYMDKLINDWANAKTISINRENLLKAISDVNPEEDIVTFKFLPESQTLRVSETRSEYSETPPSTSEISMIINSAASFSEERKIAIYSKYLVESLNKLNTEYVFLSFQDVEDVGDNNWMTCPFSLKGQFTMYMAPIKLNYEESNSC